MINPKHETRNPKQIRMKKILKVIIHRTILFRTLPVSDFEFVSRFGFRISNLG